MKCFTVVELKRPGLLRRIGGGKLRENCFVEVENLLATKGLADVTAADIINVMSAYEIPREEAMTALSALYERGLQHAVADAELTEDERNDLKHLRYVLDLDPVMAEDVEATVLRGGYRKQLKRALLDSILSDEEKQHITNVAANFTLSEDVRATIYKEETVAVMVEAYKQAIEDRRLTDEEEQRLAKMSENLGVTISHDPDSLRILGRFKLLAKIEAGELPTVATSVRLQRGEVCHGEFLCSLHEKRTVTKRIHYHGPSGSVRIMKGLSWRYGSRKVTRVTSEEMQLLDSGTLYITNKRLLFDGASKNVQTPFKKITNFILYSDGLQIEKETGRDQFYIGTGDLELISEILESALRIAA